MSSHSLLSEVWSSPQDLPDLNPEQTGRLDCLPVAPLNSPLDTYGSQGEGRGEVATVLSHDWPSGGGEMSLISLLLLLVHQPLTRL